MSSSATSQEPEFGPETDPEDAAQNILGDLRYFNHTKWGWVIYRCTYGDDAAWERFREIITSRAREDLAERDHVPREVVDGMDWKFFSDQATLDGASREQLRRRFRTWADEAEKTDQPGAYAHSELKWGNSFLSQRYKMFVQVDEEALRSVVDADPSEHLDVGWVNLVRADEGMDRGLNVGVFGSEEEHVEEGWMMIASDLLGPDFYNVFNNMPESWYVYYSAPPQLVVY